MTDLSFRHIQNKIPVILFSPPEKIAGNFIIRLFSFTLLLTVTLCSACSESPEQIYHRLDTQARQCMADKQYNQAISTWEQLLSLQPDAPNIYPNLAKSYELNGQYSQALQALNKHLTRHPDSLETLINIMQIQLRFSDLAGARTSWERLQPFPNNPQILIIHGDLLAMLEQYIPAIEEYKKALSLDPTKQMALARLAVILLGQNKPEEAKTFYLQLEALHPESSAILLQQGNYQLLTGDEEKADLFLQKAIDLAPEDQNLRIKLAGLYLDSGRYSQAVDIFRQLFDKTPGNRFYKKMLIEVQLLSKQFTQADKLINTLSAAENQDVDFLLLKGKYYLNTGNYLVAASQFELALTKEPRLPLGHYFLALAYLAGGQNNLGQQSLIKSLTLAPYFTAAELALADHYYKTGDYNLALEYVTRTQKREPENFRSFQIQGNILLGEKKYIEALTAFQKAYTLNPSMEASVYYTGVLFSLNDQPRQALKLYRSLITRQPLLADATLLYTRLLCKQGNHDEALDYLRKTIAENPDAPYLHHIAGLTFLLAGNKQKATKAFKAALHLAPGMKEAYLQLFQQYQNNSIELQNLLVEATSSINEFEEAQIRLASFHIENHKPKKAIALLQKALVRTPNSPFLVNNLAWLYLEYQPDNLDEAMRLATLAYDKLSDNAAVIDTLGWVYYNKHLPIRAGWLLEEAATLEPNNPQILYHLAIVQMELGKITPARKNLGKARELARNRLQLLKKIDKQLQLIAE